MLKVTEGTIFIDSIVTQQCEFLGSTAKGTYPPPGFVYKSFFCKPKNGESGILVFSGFNSNSDASYFFQFWWEKDKLIVAVEIERPAHGYNLSKEFGLMVQVRDLRYVTKIPTDFGAERYESTYGSFLLVDLIDILKYINGQSELKDLDKAASSLFRKTQAFVRMKQENQEKEKELANVKQALMQHEMQHEKDEEIIFKMNSNLKKSFWYFLVVKQLLENIQQKFVCHLLPRHIKEEIASTLSSITKFLEEYKEETK
ncbi:MAG: hypothetical protein HYT28_02210 [Parcubacteria group bacterium]|nr:hypothetical protein [Parcubacteria group bacterium]